MIGRLNVRFKMDEIDLIRSMSQVPPVPDEVSRRRMAERLAERIDAASPQQKRRASRSALTVFLVAASIGITGTAIAGGLAALWTDKEPIAVRFEQDDSVTGGYLEITDPNARVTSPQEFAQAVSEFAPAIRLPEGHDFAPWIANITSDFDPDAGWTRKAIPVTMTFVARCQWGQSWIDANEAGDEAQMLQASTVLGQIGRSMDDGYTRELAEQMRGGDAETIRSFVDVNCGNTGAQIGTPQQLDDLVKADLNAATRATLEYSASHGGLAGFSAEAGERLAPQLTWMSYENSNPASPGPTNVEVAEPTRVLLTQESETGVTFCVDIGADGTTMTRGTVSQEDAELLHRPGPGSNPQIECEAGW